MITVTKEQAKAIWDIYTANKKQQSVSFSPLAGVDVTLMYVYTFSLRYGIESELVDSNVKLSRELKKFSDKFDMGFEYLVDSISLDEYIPKKEFNALDKAFDKARNSIPEIIRNRVSDLHNYSSFENFWKNIQGKVEVLNAPAPTMVKLNLSYTAEVAKGSNNVRVGCQTIPIENIKELVRVIESVNA